jgi:hypothetical protein
MVTVDELPIPGEGNGILILVERESIMNLLEFRMRSRNSFKKIIVNIEIIKENIRSNQNQKRYFGPDTVMLEQMI